MSASFHPRCSGSPCQVSVSRRMRSSSSRSRWKWAKKARDLERSAERSPCESEPEKASPSAMKRVTPDTTSRNCSTVRVESGAEPRNTAIRRCMRSQIVRREEAT
eukprot:scaffold63277_cov63-Phaeocystis_antarctica.AAC.1